MEVSEVIVKCQKCKEKALFKSSWVVNYVRSPSEDGYITCTHCGYNGKHKLSSENYFYQIPIGNRTLYARNINNLVTIKDFFEQGMKTDGDPNLDFPKEFYLRKDEIIEKINALVKEEKK